MDNLQNIVLNTVELLTVLRDITVKLKNTNPDKEVKIETSFNEITLRVNSQTVLQANTSSFKDEWEVKCEENIREVFFPHDDRLKF